MCDCITKVNESMKPFHTELGVSIISKPEVHVRVECNTFIVWNAPKQRGLKPMRMIANYCPFCGEKYPVIETVEVSNGASTK